MSAVAVVSALAADAAGAAPGHLLLRRWRMTTNAGLATAVVASAVEDGCD